MGPKISLRKEYFTREKLQLLFRKALAYKKRISVWILGFLGVFVFLFLLVRFLEHQAFSSRIQAKSLRDFVIYAIHKETNKAVDMGIIGFSLREGVIVEDLIVSRESDFSEGKNLLSCKKLILKLSSLFSNNPYIRKIVFIEPKITIDTQDPSFGKILDYVLDAPIQEVEFKNAKIVILEGSKILMDWPVGAYGKLIRKENTLHLEWKMKGYPWEGRIDGSGTFLKLSRGSSSESYPLEANIQLEWSRIPVKKFSGYLEKLVGLSLNQGKMKGVQNVKYKDRAWNHFTQISFQGLEGFVESWEEISLEGVDLDFEGEFQSNWESYTQGKESKLQEVWKQKRKYSNNHGFLQIQKEERGGVSQYQVEWNSPKLEKFTNGLQLPYEWKGTGKISGRWEWEEKGKASRYMGVQGSLVWEEGSLQNQYLNLGIQKWILKTKSLNDYQSSFEGTIFGKKWNWKAEAELLFRKAFMADGRAYYPVSTKGWIKGEWEEIQFEDWEALLYSIKDKIEEDIQNRNEKLLPEDYFTEFRIYRYLLEELNLQIQMKISRFLINQIPLKDWFLDITFKSGNFRLLWNQENANNRMEIYSKYDMKLPYLDVRLDWEGLPWGRRIGSFCGTNFIADRLDLGLNFRSTGADTYNLSRQASFTSFWRYQGWRLQNPEGNLKVPEFQVFRTPTEVSYEWQYYGDNQYFRNITVQFPNGNYLKGNGQTIGKTLQISLYGKKGEEAWKWNLEENNGDCKWIK